MCTAPPSWGGFGVLAALLLAVGMLLWLLPAQSLAWASLAVCALVMWGVGLADDRWKLSARIRLVIQAGLALLMVYGGGIVLVDLGDPLLIGALSLGMIAVPFTVFGVVGCINALNMVDGIDGLSGTVAAGTLALVALVTLGAGDGSGHLLAMALLGGVAGFLWFNLRFGSQHRARVFMGDNGSMMLGLLIAWQLIDITQGEQPLVPPVVALWMFAVPLIDTLAVMARRVWLGKSPFSPDRHHLHHLLQRAGFRVEHTVTIIGGLHLGLGLFGLLGAWLGVPDALMFAGFVAVFAVYLRFTARPWRFVPMLRRLHRSLHLTPALNCGVFFGNSSLEHVEQINALVAPELKDNTVFRTRLYEYRGDPEHAGRRYAVVQIVVDEDIAPLAYRVSTCACCSASCAPTATPSCVAMSPATPPTSAAPNTAPRMPTSAAANAAWAGANCWKSHSPMCKTAASSTSRSTSAPIPKGTMTLQPQEPTWPASCADGPVADTACRTAPRLPSSRNTPHSNSFYP